MTAQLTRRISRLRQAIHARIGSSLFRVNGAAEVS
jgi:hypothetical protein